MKYLFLGLIRVYQLAVSPLLGPRCRFYPSCSRYAYQAFDRHGCARGAWLTVRRLIRCHPWNPGGIDEVPPKVPRVGRRRSSSPAGGRLAGSGPGSSQMPEPSTPAGVQCHQGAAR